MFRFPAQRLTSLPKHEQLISLLMQYDVLDFQTDGDAEFCSLLAVGMKQIGNCDCSHKEIDKLRSA